MKLKKAGFILLSAVMLCSAFTGCNDNTSAQAPSNGTSTAPSSEASAGADLSGAITMAGSTSMEKFASALSEAFMEEYSNVTVTAEYTGSGAGIEAVTAGTVDIGNASRALKDDEKAAGIVENIVAIDGIAIVTDTNNSVTNLTEDQLIDIYKGNITNWSDLGGDDQAIVVIGRESGSGTRGAFEELLDIEDECNYAQEVDSTGGVIAKVSSTPGAIGYVSLDVIDDTVSALSLNSVEATEANIKSGDYLLSRPFVMATNGEISEQNELVQALFEYINSAEGQAIIEEVGLISAK